jgi:hypothetical protein
MAWFRFLVIERLNGWAISHGEAISVVESSKDRAIEIAIKSANETLKRAAVGDRAHVILHARCRMPEEVWFGEREHDS